MYLGLLRPQVGMFPERNDCGDCESVSTEETRITHSVNQTSMSVGDMQGVGGVSLAIWIAMGMSLGTGLGAALCALLNNIALGVALGSAVEWE